MNEKHATLSSHDLNNAPESSTRGKDTDKDERRGGSGKNAASAGNANAPAMQAASGSGKGSSSGATALAVSAFLIALASAGGGYFLWQNLSQIQLSAAKSEGVSIAELEKSEMNIRSWVTTQGERAAAETGSLVNSTRADLEKQIAAVDSRVQQTIGEVRQDISAVQNSVAQQDAAVQAALGDAKTTLQQQIQQTQSAAQAEVANVKTDVASLSGAFQELRDHVNARVQTSEETQKQLQATVQQSQSELKEALGRNQLHWALNEVEYMLSIANRQVALEHNVPRAITTLRTADQRLQSLSDPGLLKVREAVQNDIAALEQVGSPDVERIALAIDRLSQSVATLPVPSDRAGRAQESGQVPEDASVVEHTAGAAKGLAQAAWDSLRGLVVVREHGEVAAPFLPPEQLYFLQQNLRLQLSAARLAALQQNNSAYQSSLTTAAEWTNKYFDTQVPETQRFAATLEELKTANVTPALPDVSQSLRVLREVRPGLSS